MRELPMAIPLLDTLFGAGLPGAPGGQPGRRPEGDREDRSHSKSWSKSRGPKASGKGHTPAKQR